MKDFRIRIIAIMLLVWLNYPARPLVAAGPMHSDSVRQQVKLFDIGTEVKLILKSKKTFQGAIESIGPEGFVIVFPRDGRMESIDYDDVVQVRVRNLRYRANANQKGTTARSVAAGLGAGTVVSVKTSWGRTLTGRIVHVREQSVELLPNKGASYSLAYDEIRELGTKKSRAAMFFVIGFVLMFQAH